MRMFNGYRIFLAASMLMVATVAAVERVTERIATFVLSLFAPAPFRLATDGPSFERSVDREPLSASLLESLRHEKGARRRSADRHI